MVLPPSICVHPCSSVADSNPEAEYEETLAKAAGFLAALNRSQINTNEHKLTAAKSSG
jgi:hypothetical protein